jgi:tetratricopeptide (TPR) repeat protein
MKIDAMRRAFMGWNAPVRGYHIIAATFLTLAASLPAADLKDAQTALDQGHYEEAEKLARAFASGATEAQALNLIGASYLYRGDYAHALESFERSRLLHQQRGEPEQEATRWVNIGAIHFYQGRYLEAAGAYRHATDIAALHNKESWSAGVRQLAEVNRATLLQRLGRDQDALDLYLAIRRGSLHIEPGEEAQMLSNLGALYRRLGDPYKALESERAALARFRQLHNLDGELGAMKNIAIAQVLDFDDLPAARRGLDDALALAERSKNRREVMQARLYLGEVLQRGGDAKAAAAQWQLALHAARELRSPEDEWRALYGLGRANQSRHDWIQAAAIIEKNRAQVRHTALRAGFLADHKDVYDALIDTSSDDSERLSWLERSRGQTPVAISALQQQLPSGALLLVYWVARSKAGLLWISPTGSGWRPLAWDQTTIRAMRRDWPKWGPRLLPDLPPARTLIFVPDGVLSTIPLDALNFPDGSRVLDRCETWNLPSSTFLTSPPASKSHRWPWERQLLGVGDPAVPTVLPGDERWTRLPRAAGELRMAADILSGRSDLFLGNDARLGALAASSRYAIVHLATHAAADSENPARSRILFSGPEYLFLRDIPALNLKGVELVTLSACETDAAVAARGDAPLSLSRAFLEAGSGATLGTLWAVSDQAAAELMTNFYRALSHGDSKAAALREAKLKMIRRSAPLEDWGAFVLTGRGAEPLRPFWSWSALLSAGAVLLIAVALLLSRVPRSPGPPE